MTTIRNFPLTLPDDAPPEERLAAIASVIYMPGEPATKLAFIQAFLLPPHLREET